MVCVRECMCVCVCVLLVMGKFINPFNIDEIYRHSSQKYVISRILWKLPQASEFLTSPPLLPHAGTNCLLRCSRALVLF